MTIELTDNITTVELNDPTAELALARQGWAQSGADEPINEIFNDVEEKINLVMLDSSDADRADDLQNIVKLGRLARQLQSSAHPDHLNPAAHVNLKAQTPTEGAPRWSLVRDAKIDKLGTAHYGNGQPSLSFKIMREGFWRGLSPTASPTSLSSTTLRSVPGLGNGNHVTIAPASISGDMPGLAIFELSQGAVSGGRISIVRRIGDSVANLNKFEPYLWSEDQVKSPAPTMIDLTDIAADISPADAPDTIAPAAVWKETGSSDSSLWKINPVDYSGRYAVYAIYFAASVTGTLTLQTSNTDIFPDSGTTKDMVIAADTRWTLANMGQIKIPRDGEAVRGAAPAVDAFEIALTANVSSGTAYIAGICLVPIDRQIVSSAITSGYITSLDGEIERAYYSLLSNGDYVGAADMYGRFPTVQPGFYNRFYILPDSGLGDVGFLIDPADDIDFDLNYIPRYEFLT